VFIDIHTIRNNTYESKSHFPMLPRHEQSVADLMREWRRVAGLSRAEAGAQIGLAPGTIRDIEQGLSRAAYCLRPLCASRAIPSRCVRSHHSCQMSNAES
jgi:DNA-binding XRE family transcriptional regulator